MKILLWSLAFIPLLMDPRVMYPYVSLKSLFIQTVIFICLIWCLSIKRLRAKLVSVTAFPIVKSSLIFLLAIFISTLFATDKYIAWWGEMSRVSGFINMASYFSFLLVSLAIFEKKDWMVFFRLNLITGLVLIIAEIVSLTQGITRPGPFTGNPTYLAGYLLYIITLVMILWEGKIWWKIILGVTFISSIFGIVATQTRGAILGLFGGLVIWLILIKNKLAVITLIILTILSIIFVVNKDWQKVPGLNRIVLLMTDHNNDGSRFLREISYQTSLRAINPVNNGIKNFLIGWGPENVPYAFYKYFDQRLNKYGEFWWDRTHNKFLDIMIMNGLISLICYIFIWLIFFCSKYPPFIFFGIAILIHMMVAFDEINIFIPIMSLWAYSTYFSPISTKPWRYLPVFGLILAILIGFMLITRTIPTYYKMVEKQPFEVYILHKY